MNQAPPTPKGFRDITPDLAKKRREAINRIVPILEKFDFVPIETPTVEFADTLTGKYGEEEKLIYKFKDRGNRDLALRYDLTVPLARFVASNQQLIAKGPFRRYQIGQVFRGENPQAGRWREFTQFDFDSIGSAEVDEDAKVVAAALKSATSLNLDDAVMLINDRAAFADIPTDFVRALDKLHKIGEEGIIEELKSKNYEESKIDDFLASYKTQEPTSMLSSLIEKAKSLGVEEKQLVFDSTLARGLDYYTGAIFELKQNNDPASLSIGAGGRYDNLIGMFAKRDIPAVGFSFGLDRLVDALR